MERGLGAILSPKDVRDYRAVCVAGDTTYPDAYEVFTPPVKDQGSVGSCVAHSLAAVIEMFNHHQEADDTTMSTGFIYGNRLDSNHKGEGMITRDALKAVLNYGTSSREKFPENIEVPGAITKFEERYIDLASEAFANSISSYYSISSDNAIKAALMQGDTVIFVMPWFIDIRVVDGVLTTSQNSNFKNGYHCMVIYGWNEKGWLIQNSWGTDWGTEGRCVLPYDIKRTETWGLKDTQQHIDAKKAWVEKAKEEVESYKSDRTSVETTISQLEALLVEIEKGNVPADAAEIRSQIEQFKVVVGELTAKIDSLEAQIKVIEDQFKKEEEEELEIIEPYQSKIGKIIAAIINFILNLFRKK